MRVTSHERSYGPKGTAVTKPEHRPRSHREFGEWPPERLAVWAQKTGPNTGEVAQAILSRGPHPESGRRACLALLRMADRYGSERLEAACARAIRIGNPTRKSVEAILKSGFDKVAVPSEMEGSPITHENIRGGDYFDRGETRAPSADEIEAHYLSEERSAIRMDTLTDAEPRAPDRDKSGNGAEVIARPVEAAPHSTDRPSTKSTGALLPAILTRLKTAWEQPAAISTHPPRDKVTITTEHEMDQHTKRIHESH